MANGIVHQNMFFHPWIGVAMRVHYAYRNKFIQMTLITSGKLPIDSSEVGNK